jgi:hypothetical protein
MYNRDCVIIKAALDGAPITGLTASKNSDAIDLGRFVEAIAFLPVTAHSGTPTLDCKIQYSPDYDPASPSTAHWMDSGDAFTQVTTVDSVTMKKLTANFGKWVRLVFTLGGGTPNYTVAPVIVAKQ